MAQSVNHKNRQPEVVMTQGARRFSARRICLVFLAVACTAFCTLLVYSLYDLQVNGYETYSQKASQLHWRRIEDYPTRGNILDANGHVLAGTTYVYTIGATPKDVRSLRDPSIKKDEISAQIADILDIDKKIVDDALVQIDQVYVLLTKEIERPAVEELRAYLGEFHIGGIRIDPVPKRYYTGNELGCHVIGFASVNGQLLEGRAGLEWMYDRVLSGRQGYTYVEVDNYSSGALPYSAPTTIEAVDGMHVQLYIDSTIQTIAQDACRDAFEIYDVIENVSAIVMDPYTGGIVAMASYPDYNLNDPFGRPALLDEDDWTDLTSSEQIDLLMSVYWRNRVISDTYEPGSTFKALTTAISFEENLTHEGEYFSDDPIDVSEEHTITCWRENQGGNHGTETLREAFHHSCNPVFVQLAWRIGIQNYYDYMDAMGFCDPTGIDLPAEGSGILHHSPSRVDLASLSFGESSTVTPIQMASVYCALINGGTLMQPQVARAIIDKDGHTIQTFEPTVIRQVFSEQTTERVMELMRGVVAEGTGIAGYVEGYKVAGKTSTSTVDAGPYKGHYVLSFAGYAPHDNPQFLVLVIVNMPEDTNVGSYCATKAAADILMRSLETQGVPRDLIDYDYTRLTVRHELIDVTQMTYKDARRILYEQGHTVIPANKAMKDDDLINQTFPEANTLIRRQSTIVLYTQEKPDYDLVRVPDFEGKVLSECLMTARNAGINIVFEGDPRGRVTAQIVLQKTDEQEPDTADDRRVSPGTIVRLTMT